MSDTTKVVFQCLACGQKKEFDATLAGRKVKCRKCGNIGIVPEESEEADSIDEIPSERDYYEILGVSRTASTDDIKTAYRRLVKKYHPDVSKSGAHTEAKFKEVQKAYDVLCDEEKRQAYDQFLRSVATATTIAGYDDAGLLPCEECGRLFTGDRLNDYCGRFLCNDCIRQACGYAAATGRSDTELIACEGCGGRFTEDRLHDHLGRILCEDCVKQSYGPFTTHTPSCAQNVEPYGSSAWESVWDIVKTIGLIILVSISGCFFVWHVWKNVSGDFWVMCGIAAACGFIWIVKRILTKSEK